jgi:hypothetical protein
MIMSEDDEDHPSRERRTRHPLRKSGGFPAPGRRRGPGLPPSGTVEITTWHVGQIYFCSGPRCGSKVLVIQEPKDALGYGGTPTCVCGKALERKAGELSEPEGVPPPSKAGVMRDPKEEPE